MEQLQMSELMTAEQWIAKLRSKVNEIVVAVNELQEAITQRNLTHTVNMKISAELDSANKEIDRLTKENEELKAKLLKVSEYAKQKRIALNCHLTCVMRPEEILHMIGEKV